MAAALQLIKQAMLRKCFLLRNKNQSNGNAVLSTVKITASQNELNKMLTNNAEVKDRRSQLKLLISRRVMNGEALLTKGNESSM